MSGVDVMRDPGYRWAVSSTTGWKNFQGEPVEGPWHWSRYSQPDADGFVLHHHGYAGSRSEAMLKASGGVS